MQDIADMDELDDGSLVRMAQAGDREAFGELVRRHRAKAFGYAKTIAQEPFMAEDIVQDALVKAFLHLGTLVDTQRFLPWLHRIVRNQAYTKLKSKSIAMERTFSGFQPKQADCPDEDNWRDLDNILLRLSRSVSNGNNREANPEERLMRQELFNTIVLVLSSLNRRERQVFESHFFEHLPPDEIAKLFQLSQANVYQILSRAKRKVIQRKIRIVVDHYIQNRRDLGRMNKKVLTVNEGFEPGRTWTSAAGAMFVLLQHTDRRRSLPMVMGLSGHAFRINIFQDDVHIAGPTAFDFSELLAQGLRNLGFKARIVSSMRDDGEVVQNANLVDPFLNTPEAKNQRKLNDTLPEALDFIHHSIEKGYPVIGWDLTMPEFGLIVGYDDERHELAVSHFDEIKNVQFDHLGRGLLEEIFLLSIDEPAETDLAVSLRGALTMILRHYRGEEAPFPRSTHGLAAYDVWRDAFRGGAVEPNGNAYNVAVVTDARRYAAAFWSELRGAWTGDGAQAERLRGLMAEAAELYGRIAEPLEEMRRMFPFPAGGEPNDPQQAERAIALLTSAKALEEQAVAHLESIAAAVSE